MKNCNVSKDSLTLLQGGNGDEFPHLWTAVQIKLTHIRAHAGNIYYNLSFTYTVLGNRIVDYAGY
jgi:hypothetical protein